jgi:hypothetical protein
MRIEGQSKVVLKDILVDEVWLASGQSICVAGRLAVHSENEIAEAKYPN